VQQQLSDEVLVAGGGSRLKVFVGFFETLLPEGGRQACLAKLLPLVRSSNGISLATRALGPGQTPSRVQRFTVSFWRLRVLRVGRLVPGHAARLLLNEKQKDSNNDHDH
jgi:hypothetical protein